MTHPAPSLPSARLLAWAAWSPDRADREAWRRWARGEEPPAGLVRSGAAAPCAGVPALLRRRCSTLSRMMMEAALEACRLADVAAGEVTMVYCSQHGEMGVLRQLLEDLFERRPMSPALFSGSVHHSATGCFDLAAGNRLPSRTLSGGAANLVCGYLEALGMIRQWPSRACLLMFADERVPEPFETGEGAAVPCAIGYMLGGQGAGKLLGLKRGLGDGGAEGRAGAGDPVLDFLRWLECDEAEFSLATPFGNWTWNK